MKRKLLAATSFCAMTAVVALAFMALLPGSASAYEFWDAAGTNDCAQCHNAAGGFGTFGSLHDLHTPMVSDCDTCHPSGPGSTPVATNASGPITGGNGVGCIGCHSGPGLREHHRNVTPAASTCGVSSCHPGDSPAAENVLPPYYATADVNGVDDPCNPTAAADTNENWDANFVGLDNDGDTLYDGSDPDCQGTPPPPDNPAVPDIKANGMDGQITVARGEKVMIDVALACNDDKGTKVDYVAVILTPFGFYHYDLASKSYVPGLAVTVTAPCTDLTRTLLNLKLPGGSYTFYWALDLTPDGIVTPAGAIKDQVKVKVQ